MTHGNQHHTDMSEDEYNADPCPKPSASSSILVNMLQLSPLHAWHAHPRLNPDYEPDNRATFDKGRAAHLLLLKGESNFELIDAENFRTKAAREARDAAYEAGKIPLLESQFADVKAMVGAAQWYLTEFAETVEIKDAEHSLIWCEDEKYWCRARPDWYDEEAQVIYNYKTTTCAEPGLWARRQLWGLGFDVSAAWYMRAARHVMGWEGNIIYRFLVQENAPPYAVSVVEMTPAAVTFAEHRMEKAFALWKQCLDSGSWPAYPNRICFVDAPAWVEMEWSEREAREDFMRDEPDDDMTVLDAG